MDDKRIGLHYTCSSCRKEHHLFEDAAKCCNASFIECPLSELPDDAELGCAEGMYGYGTVFTHRWELHTNNSANQTTRVYPLPPLMSKSVRELADARYEQGFMAAQEKIRRALGL